MNFAALKTALSGRGFQTLTDTQLGEDVNDARQRLDNLFLWPYREKSVVGVAPLAVTDLGTIEAVTNETHDYQIAPASYQWLLDTFGDLTLDAAAEFFYVATPAGAPVVATCPSNGDTIGVQYWKRTPVLSADGDEPLAPADYHTLIVDMAAQRAYMRSTNFQAGQALQPFIDQGIQGMINTLLGGQQIAGPGERQSAFESCDG